MGGSSSKNAERTRDRNTISAQRGRDVVHVSQLALALGWSTARVRAVDDILKPIRLADSTRVYHLDRALALIKVFDDMDAWNVVRAAHERRNERRRDARNFLRVQREVNAADPNGLLRIGVPSDEYDSEIREIVGWLPDCRTERQVRAKLQRLFVRKFTRSVAGPRPRYATLAKALYQTHVSRVTVLIGRKP
jgi:hypothetical protein